MAQSVLPNSTEVIHLDEKLSHHTITNIYQDSIGLMWFGSFDGLNRYNGTYNDIYKNDPSDSSSLTSSYIHKTTEDDQGNLWVGTTLGLNKYDRTRDSFRQYIHDSQDETSLPMGGITDILIDSKSRMWVIGNYVGLYDPVHDRFINYAVNKTPQSAERPNGHNSIYEDHLGRIWFLCHNEIYYFSPETESTVLFYNGYEHPMSDKTWYFRRMVQTKDNIFWISTSNAGIIRSDLYENDRLEIFKDFKGINNNELIGVKILQLYLDSQERMWVSAENLGLFVFGSNLALEMRFISDPDNNHSISFNSIWSIFEDKTGRFWLGTWEAGVDVIDPYNRKFNHYKFQKGENSLSNNSVKEFIEDEKGNLYIATDGGGLNYYNRSNQSFKVYKNNPNDPKSISVDATLNLTYDDKGLLWIGTWNGGINVFDPKTETFSHINPSNSGLSSLNIFDLYYDQKSRMYCGTWGGGLCYYDMMTKEWHTFRTDLDDVNSMSDYIFSVQGDSKGNIWIATINGLFLLKPSLKDHEKFIRFLFNPNDTASISANEMQTIYEDANQQLWIGTQKGLNLYSPQSNAFTKYQIKDGLINDNISSIMGDDLGYYWLGTNEGLVRFDQKNNHFRTYKIFDGIQGNQYSRNSTIKLSTGEIAIGGTNGFNIFDPSKITDNPNIPSIVFTDFKLFNETVIPGIKGSPLRQSISYTKELILDYTQNLMTFEFVALNYTHPQRNQHAYFMEGIDKDWNYVGSQHSATYTNLDPGTYTFRVKASNNDDVWNEKGISITIYILPPWWKTWWAQVIWIGLALVTVYSVVRFRTSYLRAQRNLLKKMVSERTEELKIKNERIAMQAEELQAFNDSLNALNENLEQTVHDRTIELMVKNDKLAEYAFFNAHNLRVPVANIKGIIQLFRNSRSNEEALELIELLSGQSEKLDEVLKEIQRKLERDNTLSQQEKISKPTAKVKK